MAVITGTEGPDALNGTSVTDTIDGLGGDDVIDGGQGADDVDGGSGDDQITSFDGGEDKIETSESRYYEFIEAGDGNDTIFLKLVTDGSWDIVDGGAGIDRLDADFRATSIPGDVDYGNDGAGDITFGISSVRTEFTSIEEIIVRSDSLWFVRFGDGDDTVSLADGDRNDIDTGGGDDVVTTAAGGIDLIFGGAGNDYLESNGEQGEVHGGSGDDTLLAQNRLYGEDGNDILQGGPDAELHGGDGNDIYIFNGTEQIIELADQGIDEVRTVVSFTLTGNLENVTLWGTSAIDATGNAGANVLIGNDAANNLNGLAGADTMAGGGGNDSYFVDVAGDVVIEQAGGGTDHVRSAISYTLGANVENLALAGSAANNGTGNELANILTGNNAANILDGRGGADRMVGRDGNDTYFVDNIADVVIENAGQGTDTVRSSITYTLSATEIEKLVLTGGAAIDGTGNNYANVVVGNGAANSLSGGLGNDRIEGRGGDDQLFGGLGNDILYGEAGADGFRFDTALNAATNVDTLADFAAAGDTVFLDNAVFAAAGPNGTLAASAFRLGDTAADADDRILYDGATGFIYYDSDGAGGADAVLFARVQSGTALTNADFVVYG